MRLLEIKCPSRRFPGNKIKVEYLSPDGNVNPKHSYYTQMQCQLYVANLHKIDFFAFTKEDNVLVTLDRDENFLKKIIPHLGHIFF